jgi:SAM-dependent methyltransferase
MRLALRLKRLLGFARPARFDGPPELAELLEPIRWEEDVFADVAAMIGSLDLAQLQALRERYAEASPAPGYSKYLEVATYVALQVRYARELGLAARTDPPRRVLDIGTGAGYFPFVCRHYGHQATAIDLDTTPMYNDLVRLLGVDRVTWRVTPFVPLPDFPERFDCVTAMQLKFNTRPQGGPWGREEWSFFLEDLAHRVAHPDAQVFLGFNADRSGVAVGRDLSAFLRERGAIVDDWKVTLPSLRAFARERDRAT